ncbi:major facilitator superfamily domain-containing protein [Apodospora peruviana]|uniref:Major facilitator superfamily domain-containing protein n=1 Tax=Apodospora peruviana TaxID=516989 RepID=A0AAE0IJ71_9PEZI|nr:major facilitator superfamily domain-containing protein [Apodospora peruviana]
MGPSEKSLTLDDESTGAVSWTPEAERRLVRKIDICLLPTLWIMSLLSWMDRANLGNANIAGLNSDLQLSSTRFSMALISYYLGYIVWVPISGLLVARTKPSLYLPTIMFLWGVVTAGTSAITTYPQLVVMRVLVGILESGLTPGMVFIFSCWYLPSEFGKRSSWFVTSAQIGGIFGGLIAGGLMANLEGVRGIRGWRWLFIVEGAVTMVVAAIAAFILPDYPSSTPRLSEEEKYIAARRLEDAGMNTVGSISSGERLTIGAAITGTFKNWKTYALCTTSVFHSGTLIMTYFYPVLVKGLGYKDPIMAQYMTAPIWAVGFVFTMAAGFLTDRAPRYRGLVVSSSLMFLAIMGVAVCAVYDFTVRYVLLAFMTGGIWSAYSQVLAYAGELFSDVHPDVRAFAIATDSLTSQTGYLYGAYLFPAENAPKHLLGFGMVVAMAGVSSICYFLIWMVASGKLKRHYAGQESD